MALDYLTAKNAALGLGEGYPLAPRQNYEAISIGQRAQLGVELFSKTFDIPPELIVRKSVLSLFDEYDSDYDSAHELLLLVSELLRKEDAESLKAVLSEHHPIEWLNCVFLEDEEIDGFALVMEQSNPAVLHLLLEAMYADYKELVGFRDFYETIFKRWNYSEEGGA
jgi:hypothetical protein